MRHGSKQQVEAYHLLSKYKKDNIKYKYIIKAMYKRLTK